MKDFSVFAALPRGARSLIFGFPGSFSQNYIKVVELCTGTEDPKIRSILVELRAEFADFPRASDRIA